MSNVTSIGEYCFENCYDLASIKFSDDLTEIGLCAFNYCCSLTSVKIPDKVTELKAGVFAECENLESIEIGKGVKKLDYSVFASTKITSIFIPSNVNIIDQDAFSSMNELTSIEFEITEGWFKCYYDEWEGTAEYTEVDIDMTNLDEILQMFEALPYGYCLTQGKVF